MAKYVGWSQLWKPIHKPKRSDSETFSSVASDGLIAVYARSRSCRAASGAAGSTSRRRRRSPAAPRGRRPGSSSAPCSLCPRVEREIVAEDKAPPRSGRSTSISFGRVRISSRWISIRMRLPGPRHWRRMRRLHQRRLAHAPRAPEHGVVRRQPAREASVFEEEVAPLVDAPEQADLDVRDARDWLQPGPAAGSPNQRVRPPARGGSGGGGAHPLQRVGDAGERGQQRAIVVHGGKSGRSVDGKGGKLGCAPAGGKPPPRADAPANPARSCRNRTAMLVSLADRRACRWVAHPDLRRVRLPADPPQQKKQREAPRSSGLSRRRLRAHGRRHHRSGDGG